MNKMKNNYHINRLLFIIIFFTIIIVFPKCNEDVNNFSPFGTKVEGAAIHCILDNRLEYVLAKMQKIYIDNSTQDLSQYKVILSESYGKQYIMEDTVLYTSPNTRFFKLKSSLLKRGSDYLLLLLKSNTTISYAYCKYHNIINISEIDKIVEPIAGPIKWNVELRFPLSLPDVFLFKLYIEYQYEENSKLINSTIEIPYLLKIESFHPKYNANLFIYEYDYDDLDKTYIRLHLKSDSTNYQIKNRGSYYNIEYDGYNTLACLKSLKKLNTPITIKGIMAVFYSIDKTYYEYYMKPGYSTLSVRLDQPEYYTNIESTQGLKLGFFGAITADTLSFKIPEYLINDCGYKNGQE